MNHRATDQDQIRSVTHEIVSGSYPGMYFGITLPLLTDQTFPSPDEVSCFIQYALG